MDKTGHERDTVRIKWYEDGAGRTYREHHLGSDDVPDVPIEEDDLASVKMYSSDAVPVFVGHYWMTGVPAPLAPNVACTDYSVAKGGITLFFMPHRTIGEVSFVTPDVNRVGTSCRYNGVY